jgi:hypothetical protein
MVPDDDPREPDKETANVVGRIISPVGHILKFYKLSGVNYLNEENLFQSHQTQVELELLLQGLARTLENNLL